MDVDDITIDPVEQHGSVNEGGDSEHEENGEEMKTTKVMRLLLPRTREPDFALSAATVVSSISGVTMTSRFLLYLCSFCSLCFVILCCFIPLINLTAAHSEYYGDVVLSWIIFVCLCLSLIPILTLLIAKLVDGIGTLSHLAEMFVYDQYLKDTDWKLVTKLKLLVDIPKFIICGCTSFIKCVCGGGTPFVSCFVCFLSFICAGFVGVIHAAVYPIASASTSYGFFATVWVLCCCSGGCFIATVVSAIYAVISLVMESPDCITNLSLFGLKHVMKNGTVVREEEDEREGEGESDDDEADNEELVGDQPLIDRPELQVEESPLKMLIELVFGDRYTSTIVSLMCISYESFSIPVKIIAHFFMLINLIVTLFITCVVGGGIIADIYDYRPYNQFFFLCVFISLTIFQASMLICVLISIAGYVCTCVSPYVHLGETHVWKLYDERDKKIMLLKLLIDVPRLFFISCFTSCRSCFGMIIPLCLCGVMFFGSVVVGCISSLVFLNQDDGLLHYGRMVQITFLFGYFSLISIGVIVLCVVVVCFVDAPDWGIFIWLSMKKWVSSFFDFGQLLEPEIQEEEERDIDEELNELEDRKPSSVDDDDNKKDEERGNEDEYINEQEFEDQRRSDDEEEEELGEEDLQNLDNLQQNKESSEELEKALEDVSLSSGDD